MTSKKYQWAIVEIDEEPYLTFCGATCEYLDEQGIKFIMFYSDCPPPSFPSLRAHTDVRGVQFLAVVDRETGKPIDEASRKITSGPGCPGRDPVAGVRRRGRDLSVSFMDVETICNGLALLERSRIAECAEPGAIEDLAGRLLTLIAPGPSFTMYRDRWEHAVDAGQRAEMKILLLDSTPLACEVYHLLQRRMPKGVSIAHRARMDQGEYERGGYTIAFVRLSNPEAMSIEGGAWSGAERVVFHSRSIAALDDSDSATTYVPRDRLPEVLDEIVPKVRDRLEEG